MGLALPFQYDRANRQPLDSSEVFNSLTDLDTYCATGARYAGQLVKVRNSTNTPDVYIINEDFTYSKLESGGDANCALKLGVNGIYRQIPPSQTPANEFEFNDQNIQNFLDRVVNNRVFSDVVYVIINSSNNIISSSTVFKFRNITCRILQIYVEADNPSGSLNSRFRFELTNVVCNNLSIYGVEESSWDLKSGLYSVSLNNVPNCYIEGTKGLNGINASNSNVEFGLFYPEDNQGMYISAYYSRVSIDNRTGNEVVIYAYGNGIFNIMKSSESPVFIDRQSGFEGQIINSSIYSPDVKETFLRTEKAPLAVFNSSELNAHISSGNAFPGQIIVLLQTMPDHSLYKKVYVLGTALELLPIATSAPDYCGRIALPVQVLGQGTDNISINTTYVAVPNNLPCAEVMFKFKLPVVPSSYYAQITVSNLDGIEIERNVHFVSASPAPPEGYWVSKRWASLGTLKQWCMSIKTSYSLTITDIEAWAFPMGSM